MEIVADLNCKLGEGPLWHPVEKRLYWVDIDKGQLLRYDPLTAKSAVVFQGDAIGGFTLQADGSLLLFMARGAVKTWLEGQMRTVIEEIPEERATRFNDVVADPAGRVFCGTMPTQERAGRLYRLDPDGSLRILIEDAGQPNGMGFSPDRKSFYFTDTKADRIFRFRYDEASGEIDQREVFAQVTEGHPDGLAVDAEGFVWSARWDGGRVERYAPDGTLERRLEVPARNVTSLTFGGPDLSDMYLTTAEPVGALFWARLGIRGMPDFPSQITLQNLHRNRG